MPKKVTVLIKNVTLDEIKVMMKALKNERSNSKTC